MFSSHRLALTFLCKFFCHWSYYLNYLLKCLFPFLFLKCKVLFNVFELVVWCIFDCFVVFVKFDFCDYFICFVLWYYGFLCSRQCMLFQSLFKWRAMCSEWKFISMCLPVGVHWLTMSNNTEWVPFYLVVFILCLYPGSSTPCSQNLCLYGSTCQLLSSNSFQCVCVYGTSGTFCGNLGNNKYYWL